MRRKFRIGSLFFSLLAIALVLQFGHMPSLQAQDFPTKPINLILPSAAGGSIDLTSRTFVHLSQEVLGQPMVIQVRPGGGGAIGMEQIAQAKPAKDRCGKRSCPYFHPEPRQTSQLFHSATRFTIGRKG